MSISFSSRLNLSLQCFFKRSFTTQRIEISKVDDILLKSQSIIGRIQLSGFVILKQNYQPSNTTFRLICEHFGNIQNRAESHGGISFVADTRSKIEAYTVSSNIRFFPHTDGAYIDEIILHEKKYKRVRPPKFVILECITPAAEGGESIVIDGKQLLNEAFKTHPELIQPLFEKSIALSRHEFMANRVSIYEKDEKKVYSLRYSYDQDMLIPCRIFKSIKEFNECFVLNKKFHHFEKLVSKEIIIIDNKRMLHGRTEFSGERMLRRAWISDICRSTYLISAKTPDDSFYPSSYQCPVKNLANLLPLSRSLTTEPLTISTGFSFP